MENYKIITITEENLAEHPQAICYINPKHPSYGIKIDWLKQRLKEGLVIKLLYAENEKKPQGYIEYVPGQRAWRAVYAPDYLFIHCIWVYANAYKNKGIGSIMVGEVLKDAAAKNLNGAAVVSSEGAFMAKANLFKKNGFLVMDAAPPGYKLLVKQLRPSIPPAFMDWQKQLQTYHGLHIVYSNQCPWVARFVSEVGSFANSKGLKLHITELKSAGQAQQAPSPYATFNLIHNGKLLADHYISMTRFSNILTKEKLI
jgi:ribosomal protein S18 acetylase RimI-like enzyme